MENFEWGSIADWVSGIGSLLAIIISLYLTIKDNYKKLIVSYNFNYYVYEGGHLSKDSFFSVDVVNNGKIPVKIKKVGFSKFKTNKFSPEFIKKSFTKTFGMAQVIVLREESEKLPFMLDPQEMVSISLKGNPSSLVDDRYVAKKTRVYVEDSTGKFYFSKKRVKFK